MNYIIRHDRAEATTWFRRFWILALLSGLDRVGVLPVGLKGFNTLAYLANAIAPCYQIEVLTATVLKEKSGPLYPRLLWDLDRLVGVGLVSVSDVLVREDGAPTNASYSITRAGQGVAQACRRLTIELERIAVGLESIAMAYGRNSALLDEACLLGRDGNYANDAFASGDVVDFGEWLSSNATAASVNEVLNHLSAAIPREISRSVNVYAKYLTGVAAGD